MVICQIFTKNSAHQFNKCLNIQLLLSHKSTMPLMSSLNILFEVHRLAGGNKILSYAAGCQINNKELIIQYCSLIILHMNYLYQDVTV